MCSLKLQFPFPLPTRANRAVMPALCAAVLLVLAALQLVLTSDVQLPEQSLSGGGVRSKLPGIAPDGIDPLLLRNAIFAPTRTAGAEQSEATPLGGASLAGAVTVAGRSMAIVQRADGTVVRLPLGGSVSGMRLIAINRSGAVFVSGGKRVYVAFGAVASAPAAVNENEEPSE